MNECINQVVLFGDKDQVSMVRNMFNDVLKYRWVYDYYKANNLEWPSFVNQRFFLEEVGDLRYSEKNSEWFVKIIYTSPFTPFFSIIQDLLGTIDASNVGHVMLSMELNYDLFINTDVTSRYFSKKYYVYIDSSEANQNIEKMTTEFYASTIEDLCVKFQKFYNLLFKYKEGQVIDNYEVLIKAVERLKARKVYVNILHSSSFYSASDDIDSAKRVKYLVSKIIKGDK